MAYMQSFFMGKPLLLMRQAAIPLDTIGPVYSFADTFGHEILEIRPRLVLSKVLLNPNILS